jgi:hypothetical protein
VTADALQASWGLNKVNAFAKRSRGPLPVPVARPKRGITNSHVHVMPLIIYHHYHACNL